MVSVDGDAPAGLAPRRLHPASPFIGLILQIRQFTLPLLFALVAGRDSDWGAETILVGFAVVVSLLQFLSWRRFGYCIREGSLIVDKGLIQRHHREIPIDRIHHVEEIAKLQHRLFGVVSLKVDSGGGESGAEIELDAVSRREAALLRSLLAGRPELPGPATAAGRAPDDTPLVSLGVGRLALSGITNVPFAATVALIASAIQLAERVDDNFLTTAFDRVPSTVAGLSISLAGGAAIYVLFAGGASVVANYGFVLEREGDDLRTQKGLLDRRGAVVDLKKLTVVRVEETLVRRALGLCSLRLQTVSGGQGGVSSLTVPILDRGEADRLIAQLLPVGRTLPDLGRHPPAARRRLMVRKVMVSLAVAVPLAWVWRPAGLVVGGLLLLLAVCRAEVAYGALGHGTNGEILVSREGGLRRLTAVTTWERAESTRLRETPTQRWAGLATLKVDVPHGRSVSIVDARPDDLTAMRRLADGLPAALTGPERP